MKIKLDENITTELIPILSAQGHDVDTVVMEGLTGQPDRTIWAAAQQAGRLLITQDLDFADTRKFPPGTHPGLVLLRLSEPGRLAQIDYVSALLRQHNLDNWRGCHVVATSHKVRIKRPS
jgi:predicted nuclease of predicted toxin-antitoxin system